MKTINFNTKNTIIIENKFEISSNELEDELRYDVLGSELADEAYENDGFHTIEIHNNIYADTLPIKISTLKEYIEQLEKSGCNYVAIDYNCDHSEYTFVGIDAHAASEQEVEEEKKILSKKRKKELEDHLKTMDIARDKILKEIEGL